MSVNIASIFTSNNRWKGLSIKIITEHVLKWSFSPGEKFGKSYSSRVKIIRFLIFLKSNSIFLFNVPVRQPWNVICRSKEFFGTIENGSQRNAFSRSGDWSKNQAIEAFFLTFFYFQVIFSLWISFKTQFAMISTWKPKSFD